MTMPTNIKGYDPTWMGLALKLNEVADLTVPIGNKKTAQAMRLRFYGFRRAMLKHDPDNPLMEYAMQAQVTITAEGDLRLQRNPFSEILGRVLTPTQGGETFQGVADQASPHNQASPQPAKPITTEAQDATIMEFLKKQSGN